MSLTKIWLEIITPVIIVFIFIAFITYFSFLIFKNNKTNKIKTGFFSLEMDLKQYRIRMNKFYWNEMLNFSTNDIIQDDFKNGWVNMATIFEKLGPIETKKWKRAIEFCVNNQIDTELKTEIINKENNKTFLFIKFIFLSSNELRINVDWKSRKIENVVDIVTQKKDIISIPGEYKLFISFNIIKFNTMNLYEFVQRIKKILKIKKIIVTTTKNIVTIIIAANNLNELSKIRKKAIKQINKNKIYIQNFYDSLTFVEVKHLKNENDLSKAIMRTLFGLTKSKIIKDIFFFNLKSVHFNEFEEFKEAFLSIENIIKTSNIDLSLKPIKNIYDNHKIIDIFMPTYNVKENIWTKDVINLYNFDNRILDLFFIKIMSNPPKNSFLINVNDYFIHENFDILKNNNKIIYIINFVEYKDETKIIDLLSTLKKYNIKFGITINEYNSIIASIINNTQPNIILINEKFANEFNSKDNIDLLMNKLTLLSLCEKLKISPIFINPMNNKKEILSMGNTEKLYCEL